MKMTASKISAVALSLYALGSFSGCVLTDPQDGHVIQQGNALIHFGGYGVSNDSFIVEAFDPVDRIWRRVSSRQTGFAPVPTNDTFPTMTVSGTTLYDWRAQFFIPGGGDLSPNRNWNEKLNLWEPAGFDWQLLKPIWKARVRARNSAGEVLIMTDRNGDFDDSLREITIYHKAWDWEMR